MEVHQSVAEPWRVTLVDTGENTGTGGTAGSGYGKYMEGEDAFCMTYGDGVSDVDITASIAFHRNHGRKVTLTAVQPPARFGALGMDGAEITSFQEKPQGEGGWINGGFFVLSPAVLSEIRDEKWMFEREPLESLTAQHQVMRLSPQGVLAGDGYAARQAATGGAMGQRERALEDLVSPWQGRRVFLTGHTGFKGGWLALWLARLGARDPRLCS